MYGQHFQQSMDQSVQPDMVANPLIVVNWTGKIYFSLSPLAPANLVSRDKFGRPVPRQPVRTPHSARIPPDQYVRPQKSTNIRIVLDLSPRYRYIYESCQGIERLKDEKNDVPLLAPPPQYTTLHNTLHYTIHYTTQYTTLHDTLDYTVNSGSSYY